MAKASKGQETAMSIKSTNGDRTPSKLISQSAMEPRRRPPVVIVLSDSEEEIQHPKESKGSKSSEKIVTPNFNGAKKSLPSTTTKAPKAVLKEGFSRKKTGSKHSKVNLEPATYCQWNQHVRKSEEEQQGGLWKNVISPNCPAAFRNPRNIVDHYLNHLRQLQGTIECPVKDCRMLLRSSKSLKAHNNMFHQKTAGTQYTKPSSSSSKLIAAKPSGSAVNGATSTTLQSAQSRKRMEVSDDGLMPNHRKRKHASEKKLKDPVLKIYKSSDFSSSPSSKDIHTINRDHNNNINNDDNDSNSDGSDRTETDDERASPKDSVNGEAKDNAQEAKNSSHVSDSEGNSLPEVLGPFFTWLRKI